MAVISRRGEPRVVVPVDDRRAAAQGLVAFGRAQTGWDRTAIRVVSVAARAGIIGLLKTSPEWSRLVASWEAHIARALGLPRVAMTIRVATSRPNHKPVGCIVDPESGEVVAFAKFGVDPASRSLVVHESQVLDRLHATGVPDTLIVPVVLSVGEVDDVVVLLVSPVAPVLGGGPVNELPADAMADLSEMVPSFESRLAASAYWSDLSERMAEVERRGDGPVNRALRAGFDAMGGVFGQRLLTFGLSHGDFNAANMATVGDGLAVWDWERSALDRPKGMDAVRFLRSAGTRPDFAADVRATVSVRTSGVSDSVLPMGSLDTLLALDSLEMALRHREARVLHGSQVVDPGHWNKVLDIAERQVS